MAKKKKIQKNVPISVSLTFKQKQFLDEHPDFNISKFVQIHFQDFIDASNEVDRLKAGLEFSNID